MEELKPCPFCGGEAEIWLWEASLDFTAQCKNENCIAYNIGSSYETRKKAIAAWNTRASNG